jgi:hypothetical protein
MEHKIWLNNEDGSIRLAPWLCGYVMKYFLEIKFYSTIQLLELCEIYLHLNRKVKFRFDLRKYHILSPSHENYLIFVKT